MDAQRLQNSLLQILENYQRCGVTRFARAPQDAVAPELFEQIAAFVSAPTAEKVEVEHRSPTASPNDLPSRVAPEQPSTRNAAVAIPTPIGSSVGAWTLPVLALDDRRQRFETLDAQVRACRQCADIVGFRQQTVFGAGPLNPTVCFMGEAPGADEDRTGQPFVGKAGQLLSKIIAAMKLNREEVYILNALKCRPPQNRTPMPEEIGLCRNFAETQLEVLQPKFIVCLGAVAVQSILQTTTSIGRLRGRFHDYRGARVVVTYHPSYLLRQESAKRMVWEDMQMLMSELGTR